MGIKKGNVRLKINDRQKERREHKRGRGDFLIYFRTSKLEWQRRGRGNLSHVSTPRADLASEWKL